MKTKTLKLCGYALAAALLTGLGIYSYNRVIEDQDIPVLITASKPVSQLLTQRVRDAVNLGKESGNLTVQKKSSDLHPYSSVFPDMPDVKDFSTYDPASITVEVEPGIRVTYTRTNSYMAHGRKVWVGRNPAMPLSIYTAAGSEHHYYANVDLVEGAYGAEIRNGVVTTFFNNEKVNCATEHEHKSAASELGKDSQSSTTHSMPNSEIAASTATLSVDLSIFADDASIKIKGYDDMFTQVIAEVETCNQELLNSQITNFKWTLVDFVAVPASTYTFSGDMSVDVNCMPNYKKNPLGDLVQATMKASGSDEAHLLVSGGGSWGGMAYVSGSYGMTLYSQLSYRTMAHELGHNLGGLHDRITQAATASDIKGYNYGYMEMVKDTFTWSNGMVENQDTYVGDIMSYAGVRAPYFANPNIQYTYTNKFSMKSTVIKMGVDTTQDYPCYVAKAISEGAVTLSQVGTYKPHLTEQPTDANVSAGEYATLKVGGPVGSTYQWQKDGVDIAGATSTSFTIPQISSLDAGSYTCVVTSNGTKITSNPAKVTVNSLAAFNPSARLVDISTRAVARGGDAVPIAGFVLSGNTPATVLVRASGPALSAFGINGYLKDPKMTLFDGNSKPMVSNDDWDASIKPIADAVGAFSWISGSKDAGMVQTLPGGAYTAVIESKDNSTGVVLLEVYDTATDPSAPRMVDISTRSWVESGENSQIAGFVIGGSGLKTVLVRSSGPALADFGVSGTVSDPTITMYNAKGEILFKNDNWSESADASQIANTAASIGAFAFKNGSKDAAILVTLPAGAYTAVVTPKTGTSPGVGLVEVYEVK